MRAFFHSDEIHCQGCSDSIKRSLGKLDGVLSVEVDIEKTLVTIEFDSQKTSESAIQARLTLAGFPSPESK